MSSSTRSIFEEEALVGAVAEKARRLDRRVQAHLLGAGEYPRVKASCTIGSPPEIVRPPPRRAAPARNRQAGRAPARPRRRCRPSGARCRGCGSRCSAAGSPTRTARRAGPARRSATTSRRSGHSRRRLRSSRAFVFIGRVGRKPDAEIVPAAGPPVPSCTIACTASAQIWPWKVRLITSAAAPASAGRSSPHSPTRGS
jgi:hypothetical protein